MLAIKFIRNWGPGLLESAYEAVLSYELHKRGLKVRATGCTAAGLGRSTFGGGVSGGPSRRGKVLIVEIKSVEQLAPVHPKQVLTYLRIADKRLGLLVNFGEALIKNGLRRIVNNLVE